MRLGGLQEGRLARGDRKRINSAPVVRLSSSTACGSRNSGGIANSAELVVVAIAQIAQTVWPASAEAARLATARPPASTNSDGIRANGAAVADCAVARSMWLNDSTANGRANVRSASRALCRILKQKRFTLVRHLARGEKRKVTPM